MYAKHKILRDNHASLTSSGHVNEICSSLFNQTEINYFHHGKLYDNGGVSVLVSNTAFHSYFWNNKHDKELFSTYKSGILLNEPGANNILSIARNQFNLDYIIYVIDRYQNYFEVSAFATHTNNASILSYYLNNISFLKNFISSFKEKASCLIKKTDSNLIYSRGYKPNLVGTDNKSQLNDIKFTTREKDIIPLLLRGATAKKIAELLSLSPRTIECYLENIKNKMNAKSKSDLIETLYTFN